MAFGMYVYTCMDEPLEMQNSYAILLLKKTQN